MRLLPLSRSPRSLPHSTHARTPARPTRVLDWCLNGASAANPSCVACSDDVDDQYTEKGRLLVRREGEGLANGLRLGEVLAAEDLELQIPGFKGRTRAWGRLRGDAPHVSSCLLA